MFLRFIISCIRAYFGARRHGGTYYVGVTQNHVSYISVFVGLERAAWRVSQRAIEEFEIHLA